MNGAHKKHRTKLRRGACTGMRKVGFVSVGTQVRDQLCQRVGRQGLASDQNHRHIRDRTQGFKIVQGIITERPIKRRCRRVSHVVEEKGIAIGLCFSDPRRADRSARASGIFDDELLLEFPRQTLSQGPPEDICRTARGVGDHDGDRPVWELLRLTQGC